VQNKFRAVVLQNWQNLLISWSPGHKEHAFPNLILKTHDQAQQMLTAVPLGVDIWISENGMLKIFRI